MLFILIPAIWVALAFLGMAMCRLAGRSDGREMLVLDELLAAGYRVENEQLVLDLRLEQIELAGHRRAAG